MVLRSTDIILQYNFALSFVIVVGTRSFAVWIGARQASQVSQVNFLILIPFLWWWFLAHSTVYIVYN